jgi:single-stranded-DNA-specific exonuclease
VKNKIKKWQIAKSVPKKFIEQFPEHSALTLQLLYNRGLRTEEEIEKFLNPDYEESLYDPFLMKDMGKAVYRIKKALVNKEKIVIYGDYDADGVTATAVLYKTLKFLKATNLNYYIPDKTEEGYGLNKDAILQLTKKKTNLIVTVDCGITNKEEVKLANKNKMDVIITDHHLVPTDLPSAYAVLNPKQKKDKYPFADLAGVGVAFKLAQGLLKTKDNEDEVFLKWMVDLVGLGTIADRVPLVDENRVFAKYGLIVLKKTKNLGVRALMATAGVNPTNLDTEVVSFQIVPRLNAAGRMDHACASLKLLITNSYKKAEAIAENLDALNNQRQKLVKRILKEIHDQIGIFDPEKKILVLSNKDWPNAVLGLVAGKLSDEFSRPVVLIEQEKDESKGSARSIESFNITEALNKCKNLLIKFGGHRGAAGFSLKTKDIRFFEQNICKITQRQIKEKDLIPRVNIEAEINLSDVGWELLAELDQFRPFGEQNPKPNFLIENLKILEAKNVGDGEKHLRLLVTDGGKNIKAIGFGLGSKDIKAIKKIDTICDLNINEWNGARNIELKLTDFKLK